MRHRPKGNTFAALARLTGCLALLGLLALAAYGYLLAGDIRERFSGRRWSVPSRVYSDTTLLYPGERIDAGPLLEKLERLGYRRIETGPLRPGEMRVGDRSFQVFLEDVRLPIMERTGYPVEITVSGGAIRSISRLDTGESLPLLELEPEELMRFFGEDREQRRLISIDQVPEHVRRAFLAAEDVRFHDHHGLDPRGILRALWANLRHGELRQGGSTITQQLAKNYFLTPEKTYSRKLKEMLMAVTIELMYEKEEILEIYLNEIYFGQKGSVAVNGLGEASRFYFGKPVEALRPDEAAVLAGLIRAPNLYSPHVDRDRCRFRRNRVLHTLAEQGWLSTRAFRAAVERPVETVGFQAYRREAPYFIDSLSEQMETLYSAEDLSRLGLSIFTTLDTQVQSAAEEALSWGLERLAASDPRLRRKDPGERLQGAVLVIQPRSGYILAMVGGRDYGTSQFNRITQARRQPGSAFKPFVFLSALDHGFHPASRLSNVPRTYEWEGKTWRPENASAVEGKTVSLRAALADSVNLATVDLALQVGVEEIVRSASRFGFSTPLKPLPSIALGAMELVPLELARAYCAFAADGMMPHLLSLKEIAGEDGELLERRHMKAVEVTSPAKAFVMSSLLRSVVSDGTARSLEGFDLSLPVAGKTGTTDDFRDAWFVGYTPDLLALVWVGFDDGSPLYGTGASAALPIWAELVKRVPQHLSGSWFRMPTGVRSIEICVESGRAAVPGVCADTREEYFLADQAPAEPCDRHHVLHTFRRVLNRVGSFFKNR